MSRAPRPCSVPGCPNLVLDATAQCLEHRAAADRRKGTTTARGYGSHWAKIQRRHLRRYPICAEYGCRAKASTVDHINGDTRDNRPQNLRSFCALHHNKRTARDQPGGFMQP